MADEPVTLQTQRLALEPLRLEHADELVAVLADPHLYQFTGGTPPSTAELRGGYARQVVGHSPDRTQTWLNWVLRVRDTGAAVGTVQATVTLVRERLRAEVAWVIGADHQRQGYASEAAAAMVDWLLAPAVETRGSERGGAACDVVVAHIHPEHEGSMAVARAVGLHPTDVTVDGEVQWERRT